MEIQTSPHTIHSAKDQLAWDLNQKLDSFVTLSAALTAFERETGISKRQVERYLSKKTLPQFLNLKRIYSFITGINDYQTLLSHVHEVIAKELEEGNTNRYLPTGTSQKSDFSDEMQSCQAFSFIYWNTVTGNRLSRQTVERKFGEYGTKTLAKMEKREIIKRNDRDFYISGTNRSVPVNMQAAKQLGMDLIENHFSPERTLEEGNNFFGFQVFSLNKEAKKMALIKMEKLHRELQELAHKSKGEEEPFFAVVCGDSMLENIK